MKNANDNRAASAEKRAAQTSPMVIEGTEAVELYAGEIARNVTELNRQAGQLHDLYVEAKKLLGEIE